MSIESRSDKKNVTSEASEVLMDNQDTDAQDTSVIAQNYTTSNESTKHTKVKHAKVKTNMSQSPTEKYSEEKYSETKSNGNQENQGTKGNGNSGNIDQVREILFGSQLRAQEESMAQLEARLRLEQQKLNQTFNDRLDYIEAFFKEEMQSLKQLITGEIESRSVMEKRIDNAIDQQRLAAESDLNAVNKQLSQADVEIKETVEVKFEKNEKARTKLQDNLLTELEKSSTLFETSLSEQKSTFNDALTQVVTESSNAREALQASITKEMTKEISEKSKKLQTEMTKSYKELNNKLDTTVLEQDTKQMDKERLAQHFLEIATKIQKS